MSLQLMLPASIEARKVSLASTGGAAKVQLSQEQTLCLVKIFLNASLGCICFARGLIPSDSPSYRDRRVDDLVLIPLTSTPASYHNFLSFQGQLSVNTESQLFKVLVGGKDKRADHILNLVENGVFEAVDRGYLEAVQFSLSCDSSRRQDVIECYTFSFGYTECEDNGRQVCSVKVSPEAAGHFYVADAQKSFRKAIHNLLVICQQLPALPRRRSLGVSLLYNHTCPMLYEPAGFAGSPDTDTSSFDDPSTATDHVGKFHVGYYQIAVTAGHVKLIQDEAGGRSPVPETISNGGSTKESTSSRLEDLAIKRQLQAMQRSSSIPSNLISTQIERALKSTHTASQNVSQSALSAPMPGQRGSGIAVDWDSRRKLNVTPTKMAELIVQAWGLEAHNQSYVYMLDIDLLRKSNKIKRLNPGKDVRHSANSADVGSMISAMGFRAEPLNDQMPGMVRMRLALSHIYDYEVQIVTRNSLIKAAYIRADDQAACRGLVAELEDRGFIKKTSVDGVFAVVRDQKRLRDAWSEYLDPLAHILDYYVVVEDRETAQDRAKAIQEALDRYANGRSFGLEEDEPELEERLCKNALGRPIVRWGFYSERNEASRELETGKRAGSPVTGPGVKQARKRRKMSISKTMINLDLPLNTSSDIDTDDFSTTDNASTA